MSQTLNGRRGEVFPIRLTPEQRAELEAMRDATAGPRPLGPWLLWAARRAFAPVLPRRDGYHPSSGGAAVLPGQVLERVIPGRGRSSGNTLAGDRPGIASPAEQKIILDLCAGSGAWSDPYRLAGYDVRRVTLPDADVRTFRPPPDRVHGVLAAPPCSEFSLAKNGQPRDFVAGLELVSACLRIVVACRPVWWALENPVGLLSNWLGVPRDVWEPYEFGDPWTKATAIWGDFRVPERGPFVDPEGSAMDRGSAEERAITPPGFARAFYEANP